MTHPMFAIVAHGFAHGPAQALRDYLVARGAHVFTVFHPLTRDQGTSHVTATYAGGSLVAERTVRTPLKPPLSFALDPLIPPLPPRVDAWFGFDPLSCARGLVARRLGRARFVGLWSVDFVPDRFGRGTPMTRLYERLDRLCCTHAGARVELSEIARDARNARLRIPPRAEEAHIVPMGAWLERVPTTPEDGFRERRVVFLGHLVRRQGVDVLLEALAVLRARGETLRVDVIGTGPLETSLREESRALGLQDWVDFHGFVADHAEVESILARGSLAVAPYRPGEGTFTPYADPGKLKAYVAAGLPIVLTDVPPTASELAREAGAEVVHCDPLAIADAISWGLESATSWGERRRAALAYARRFDWAVLLSDLLSDLGLDRR